MPCHLAGHQRLVARWSAQANYINSDNNQSKFNQDTAAWITSWDPRGTGTGGEFSVSAHTGQASFNTMSPARLVQHDIRPSSHAWRSCDRLFISVVQFCDQTDGVSQQLAPQIQRGFPVDTVRNTNLLTYLLPILLETICLSLEDCSIRYCSSFCSVHRHLI